LILSPTLSFLLRTNARQPFERTGFGCPFLLIEHRKVQTKPLSSIAWNSTACPPLKDGRDLRYFVGTDSVLLVSVLPSILEKVVILGQKRRYYVSSSKNGFKFLLLVIFPLVLFIGAGRPYMHSSCGSPCGSLLWLSLWLSLVALPCFAVSLFCFFFFGPLVRFFFFARLLYAPLHSPTRCFLCVLCFWETHLCVFHCGKRDPPSPIKILTNRRIKLEVPLLR